jgi:hypothetical protein
MAFALAPAAAVASAQQVQIAAPGTQPANPTADPAPAAPPAGSVSGMGDVNIYPKRVVIDSRTRIGSIGLFNRSAAPGEYEIGIGDMLMTPDGHLTAIADVHDEAAKARLKSAASLVRWSPHRVSLAGNEAQTVRLMVHVPPDLPAGEYRAHVTVVSVNADTNGLSIEDAAGAKKAEGIGVRIVPRFGISIPVIVRIGDTTLEAGVRDLAIKDRTLALTLMRSGTRSAFGDIAVTAPGFKGPIAQIKGVGVYTEVDQRHVELPIDPKVDAKVFARGAKLTVTYTDDDAAPGKVLARQDFVVP